jgi:methylated-DNA-[protein]-cysteine S-methyltransferase
MSMSEKGQRSFQKDLILPAMKTTRQEMRFLSLAAPTVRTALGRPICPIIVPCHRVIGVNGKLTGFAGGLRTKEFLLHLESERQPT